MGRNKKKANEVRKKASMRGGPEVRWQRWEEMLGVESRKDVRKDEKEDVDKA